MAALHLRRYHLAHAMNSRARVTVILPTYNERENVGGLLQAILDQKESMGAGALDIVVVDDCSPDGTGDVVRAFATEHSEIHLLTREGQRGLGNAYRHGMRFALERTAPEVIFEMDADWSHDPRDFPRFMAALAEADFVIGSRYVEGGSIPEEWPALRKANSRWANVFARRIAGLRSIHDCTSGYRAIRSSVLRGISFDRLGARGNAFLMSLLNEAVRNDAVIREIPIHYAGRASGRSKLGWRDILEFMVTAVRIRLGRKR